MTKSKCTISYDPNSRLLHINDKGWQSRIYSNILLLAIFLYSLNGINQGGNRFYLGILGAISCAIIISVEFFTNTSVRNIKIEFIDHLRKGNNCYLKLKNGRKRFLPKLTDKELKFLEQVLSSKYS